MIARGNCGCPILTLIIPVADSLEEMKVIRFTACQSLEVNRILSELVHHGVVDYTQARSSWAAIQLAAAHYIGIKD